MAADEANRAGKDQEQAASDSSEDSKSQAPAKRRRSRSRKAPAAPTAPDDFIRAEVAASGKSGMAVAELSKRVRTRFKSFKVRELGYPHLAGYLADVEGVRVYKQGRENGAPRCQRSTARSRRTTYFSSPAVRSWHATKAARSSSQVGISNTSVRRAIMLSSSMR